MKYKLNCLFTVAILFILLSSASSARIKDVPVGKFSKKSLSGWQEKKFAGETQYSFVDDLRKGWVIRAISDGSASGLFKEISVDITETPFLNWSWKVDEKPVVKDEKTKDGDDYAARVYVIFRGSFWFWKTKTLNYVWNSSYPPGESWPNAFAANARMIALQSRKTSHGVWVAEKRNIQKDIIECFGIELTTIDAIAIMTDTDNSDSRAVAYYGDIFFTSE